MPPGEIYYGDPVERAHPHNRGLVSWWLPLPWYSSGPRLIEFAGRNHGTLTNGPSRAAGPNGFGALSLSSASDQYVNLGSPTGGTGMDVSGAGAQMAVGVWAHPATAHNGQLFSRDDPAGRSYALDYLSSGTYRFYLAGGSTLVSWTDPSGLVPRWVCGVCDGASTHLYVDGVLRASMAGSDVPASSQPILLGRRTYGGFEEPFNGKIGDAWFIRGRVSAATVWGRYEEFRRGNPTLIRRLRPYSFGVDAGGGGAASGTLSATLADLTPSASGALALAGSLAATLGDATSAAAGGGANSGALAATLADAALSAAGTLPISGALAATLGDASAAGSGVGALSGALSAALSPLALSGAGALALAGQAAAALAPLTLAATGAGPGGVPGREVCLTGSDRSVVSLTGSDRSVVSLTANMSC